RAVWTAPPQCQRSILEMLAKLQPTFVELRRHLVDPRVTFGHRGEELCLRLGVLARDGVECLLKVLARLLEVMLGLGQFRSEPPTFGFRGQPGSLNAIALVLIVD